MIGVVNRCVMAYTSLALFDDMTFVARAGGKGRMDILLEKFGVFGGMGIVAFHAIHLLGRDVQVIPGKSWRLKIMTFPAESFLRFGEQ